MENHELLRRAEDLRDRCERSGSLTHSNFLTPAERAELEHWAAHTHCRLLFHGGGEDCERTVAFFLPDWMEEEDFTPSDYLHAIKTTAYFGTPGHRDYLDAFLGMGVGREWLGDLRVSGDEALLFCLPGVLRHLLSIEKVGRVSVKAEELPLEAVPPPVREVKETRFSVMSLRLDAVTAGLFHLSRTEAARRIEAGAVSLNYRECLKADCPVHEGDILSLRGAGKGRVVEIGGNSRKGRIFVNAELFC